MLVGPQSGTSFIRLNFARAMALWPEGLGDSHVLPLAHLYAAEAFDRKGDQAQALIHYRRSVDLWRSSDDDMQPRVRTARESIARLTANQV